MAFQPFAIVEEKGVANPCSSRTLETVLSTLLSPALQPCEPSTEVSGNRPRDWKWHTLASCNLT